VAAVRRDGATYREVQRTGAGVAVPTGDPEALLRALDGLRSDPGLVSRLGEAGARYASTALSSSEGLERGQAFVDGLLASRTAKGAAA
jgi:glycosyltransferase involved in cell wall biosynthesis